MMDMLHEGCWQTAVVTAQHAGLRLDVAMTKLFSLSRTSLQRQIEEGVVFVNGHVQKKRYLVVEGDLVAFCPTPEQPSHLTPEPMAFELLYEDDVLLMINKPPGLVVHPAPGNRSGTIANGLVAYIHDLECQDPIRPGIVHRLDKDTSGVLIVAKTLGALKDLSRQFHDRLVHKEYLAIVAGCCTEPMHCSAPIGRDPRHRKRMAVIEGGKPAQTDIFPLCQLESHSLVKAAPHTGRTHQIRVHLATLKYPVLGDSLYGRREINERMNVKRQLLHCSQMTFTHPVTNNEMTVQAPMPNDMREILGKSVCEW